ncbi:MAG: cell division protein FtsA [Haloplasmataceae bacterium]|jgi:cell division protein FtsA|nr:cell division protein FtsA [Haloplasmataceae bacterium]
MKRNIYASVEFGSHSIKLLVSEFIEEKQNILFIDEIISTGIQAGYIIDKSLVYNNLSKLILKCENFLEAKIRSVVLMLPSSELSTKEVNYDITIPDNKVKGKHIKSLFNNVFTEESKLISETNPNQEIAYIYPNKFTSLKVKKSIDNPIGEVTRELYSSLELIYANKQMIIDYLSIIEQLNVEVVEILPNVIGFKKSLLTKEECMNYTCVVDIGSQTTTISVLNNNLIHSSESFKIGGDIVTKALKEYLNLNDDDSEEFKITHGDCLSKEATEEIIFEQHFSDGSINYMTHENVSKIVEEKYLEIIRVIRRYLLEKGLKNKIAMYVLIGGAVQIENFERLFKNNFGENVSIRTPNLIGTRHPKYSSIISGQYNILYLENLFEEQYSMVVFNDVK